MPCGIRTVGPLVCTALFLCSSNPPIFLCGTVIAASCYARDRKGPSMWLLFRFANLNRMFLEVCVLRLRMQYELILFPTATSL